jgi:Xaa-Pro aminopeptidase
LNAVASHPASSTSSPALPGFFAQRRARLAAELGPRTLTILASTPTAIRNNDVEHDYRQDSDLFYLSGFDEPETVLVIAPSAMIKETADAEPKPARYVLFVRPRDPAREIWDGYRAGVEGAKARFGADVAFPIDELATRLPQLMLGHDTLAHRFGNAAFDAQLLAALAFARRTGSRNGQPFPIATVDPIGALHEHRLCKSSDEIARMRTAARITGEAHKKAMALAHAGRHEHELEAVLLETFRRHGSERPAYGSIVGSGPNATILHYRRNDRRMEDGELVLIDAGCEYDYYASDVTRTFPVNGRFSDAQREIYAAVLDAQEQAIAMVRPGVTQGELHHRAVEVMTQHLVRLGILSGDVETLVKEEKFKPFYMHKTGHWLGMDVHDVGAYFGPKLAADAPVDAKMPHRKLEPGMVITIEPGLYFGIGAETAPEKYRGIGVRIEDDILVTDGGHENLTIAIPKTIADVEAACRG